MTRATVQVALAALLLSCSDATGPGSDPSTPATPAKRNVVLIISDDHGYPDYGFMGSSVVETPHLDRLAARGVLFTHAFATASVCKPSLRTLLTGLEPAQWQARVRAARKSGLLPRGVPEIAVFDTLPGLLGQHGYASFKAGKFWESTAEAAGFDAGTLDVRQRAFSASDFGRPSIEEAVAFIREPRDQPFFLWFAPMLPHAPFDAGPEFRERYRRDGLSRLQQRYYANVSRFDAKVGELLRAIDEAGLRENTLIIYVADNGWDPSGAYRMNGDGEHGKLTPFELGLRTPMILDLPGADARASDALVSITDIVPTVLDFAGAPTPAVMPGHSLLALARGQALPPRRELIGWIPDIRPTARPGTESGEVVTVSDGAYFLRSERFHYFWLPSLGMERLYDVATDPQQTRDVRPRHAKVARQYRDRIHRWNRRVRAQAQRNFRQPLSSASDPARGS